MAPLPISRSALDRLGERLAASDEISDEDYESLLDVLNAYQAALVETQERLTRLGYAPTTRVKTTSVLIEKLRRERGMKLKGVQDIAGARVVADCDRTEQDAIVTRIVDEFSDGARPPKVKDRRAEPSAGYRAVHVVVTVQDLPVEVQVRTGRQDEWAQIFEALADKWGRGIRYGDEPTGPDAIVVPPDVTRRDIWRALLITSDDIDGIELARDALTRAERMLQGAPPGIRADGRFAQRAATVGELRRHLDDEEASMRAALSMFRALAEQLQ